MQVGGIVLCGGQSSRMGLPKATLPFGDERMLQRVVRLLREVVDSIVVVAASGQPLPDLPDDVVITRDERAGRGQLEGLAAGLRGTSADVGYATGCDVPLLRPEFARYMIGQLGDHEIAVPVEEKFFHPLAAVYRCRVLTHVESLLSQDRLRPVFLFEQAATKRVPVESLRGVDPTLSTLRNLNHRQDYIDALREAGLEAPPEILNGLHDV